MKINIKIHTFESQIHILYCGNGKPLILYIKESFGLSKRLEKQMKFYNIDDNFKGCLKEMFAYFVWKCPEIETYLEKEIDDDF